MQTVRIPFIRCSSNKDYSSRHWSNRNSLKQQYLKLFQCYKNKIRPVDYKVNLSFTFYFDTRNRKQAYDSTNCFTMAKMLEDCLVKYKVLQNDTNKFVGRVSVESVSTKADEYCVINIDKWQN